MNQPARAAHQSRRSPTPHFTRAVMACAIGHALAAAIPAALALGPATAMAADAAPAPARKSYDIPAGALETVLTRFGREAGILLSFPADLAAGLRSQGLSGAYSVQEALPLLLQGTGLTAVAQPGGGWTLAKRAEPHAAAPGAAGETRLPLVKVQAGAEHETATGPVTGYAAKRSATATKTDTPLLETPQSVSLVGADQIADQKAISVADALAYTPGVLRDPGYSNSYDVFYSRGFRMHDGNGGVYRDGLKLGSSGWATGQQEPYGFERLELLKGAASLLYGASSPGGVLNVVTKQPQRDPVNEVIAEAGNNRHLQVAADVGKAWSGDLAGRAVLLLRDADTSIDHVPNNARYIAPSLRWTPNADTSLTLLAHHSERRTAYIWGVPAEGSLVAGADGRLPRARFVGEPGYDRQDTRQTSVGWLLTQRLGEHTRLQHGLRWIDTSNHVRFSGLRGQDAADPRVWSRVAWDELETTQGVSADTNIQAELDAGAVKHKLLAGFDVVNHHIGSRWMRAPLGPINLFDPQYGASPGSFLLASDDTEHQRRIGAYLQDQIKYGPLTTLAGIRRDEARSMLGGADTEKTRATTGRLGVVYEVASGLAPFASWSQSFEPQSGTDNDGKRYRPTRGEQVELGLRWQRGPLVTSAAVYQLEQTNVQSRRAGLEKPVQTGEVRSRGLELEAKGEVARDIHLVASYAYTDAITTKSEVAAEIGQPRVGQPMHQAALWTRVDNLLAPGAHAGLGARYVGATEDWDGTRTAVPGYTTFDVLLGYTTGPWTLRLNVANLGDKSSLLCNSGWCVYDEGRRAVASMAYRW